MAREADFGNRPIYYYDEKEFPFMDGQFDYVICSHVIENVAEPLNFLDEVFRAGRGRGYLEYPLITYEYLYDFDVHLHFVKFDFEQRVLRYLPKRDTNFRKFSAVSAVLNKTLVQGWDDLCAANKNLFLRASSLASPLPSKKLVNSKGFARPVRNR